LLLLVACSGGLGSCSGCGGSGGCSGTTFAAIDGGFPAAERQSEAISVKLSPTGLQSISQKAPGIVDSLLMTTPGNPTWFDIPCIGPQNITNLGSASGIHVGINAYVCDYYQDQCAYTYPGYCQAAVTIDGMQITSAQSSPTGPVILSVTFDAEVDTTALPITISGALMNGSSDILPPCDAVNCTVQFATSQNSPPYLPITANVTLAVDENYSNLLTFDVSIPDLTNAINTNDLTILSSNGSCISGAFNWSCSVLNGSASTLASLLQGTITNIIQGQVDQYRCLKCNTDSDCPQSPNQATCSSGLCYIDQSADTCVPAPLGIEGRVGTGSLLGTFGAPADSTLDVSVVAGGVQNNGAPALDAPNGDLQVGIMGGTNASSPSSCVPPATWTPQPIPPQMNFDAEANLAGPGMNLKSYQLGFSLSQPYLNKALFDAWQSGSLCLNVSQQNVSLLSSGLFSGLGVPANLGQLTHGDDVPMLVALRPTEAPTLTIGRGTVTGTGSSEAPDDALLTLAMNSVHIDFYAFLEEHYVRLFTLQTDLSVPVGLDFSPTVDSTTMQPTGGTTVSILLGKIAVANTSAFNNQMNVDSNMNLSTVIGSVLPLVSSALTGALPQIAIPEIEGLNLNVLGARGSTGTGTSPCGKAANNVPCVQLAVYASLDSATTGTERRRESVHTAARAIESFVPQNPLPFDATTQPRIVIDASATGPRDLAGYEYTYRIDGEPWHFWSANPQLVVDDGVLRFPGNHDIEVRARIQNEPATADLTPVHVTFPVDYSPPKVMLTLDADRKQILTSAHDDATPESKLSFRYSVSNGPWSEPGSAHAISLASLGSQPWLRVEVTDLAGRTATASYGTPQAPTSTWRPTVALAGTHAGCEAAGGSVLCLLGLAGLLRRRRR
jgi:hypothetical protein